MKYSFGYMTAPSKQEAEAIVLELLERELIACANIFSPVDSYYVWDEAIQKEKEIVVVLKTIEKNGNEIIHVVKKMHSHECPCIVFLPLENGNKDFLGWIGKRC